MLQLSEKARHPSARQQKQSEGEVLLALWSELAPDLDELDEYGGGDYGLVDHVGTLLYEIEQKLSKKNRIEARFRHELLDNVLPYIESGNAGLDDALSDVAYATCYDNNDLRALAEAFERMPGDWKTEHACRIYRKLEDRDKYLELRNQKMIYGADYHDLASFYWKSGERGKARTLPALCLGRRLPGPDRKAAGRPLPRGNTKVLSFRAGKHEDQCSTQGIRPKGKSNGQNSTSAR